MSNEFVRDEWGSTMTTCRRCDERKACEWIIEDRGNFCEDCRVAIVANRQDELMELDRRANQEFHESLGRCVENVRTDTLNEVAEYLLEGEELGNALAKKLNDAFGLDLDEFKEPERCALCDIKLLKADEFDMCCPNYECEMNNVDLSPEARAALWARIRGDKE